MNLEGDEDCTADVGPGGWLSCHRYPDCGCFKPRDYSEEFLSQYFSYGECVNDKWVCVTFNCIIPDAHGYVFYYQGVSYKMKPNHGVPCKIKGDREVVFLSEKVYGNRMSDIFERRR